uniref:Core shell protein Gag P30 domain-containing protein n=1 Tax=Monodelphis domestica TaxID=13616 RepID=A0A5F8HCD7_MONDO
MWLQLLPDLFPNWLISSGTKFVNEFLVSLQWLIPEDLWTYLIPALLLLGIVIVRTVILYLISSKRALKNTLHEIRTHLDLHQPPPQDHVSQLNQALVPSITQKFAEQNTFINQQFVEQNTFINQRLVEQDEVMEEKWGEIKNFLDEIMEKQWGEIKTFLDEIMEEKWGEIKTLLQNIERELKTSHNRSDLSLHFPSLSDSLTHPAQNDLAQIAAPSHQSAPPHPGHPAPPPAILAPPTLIPPSIHASYPAPSAPLPVPVLAPPPALPPTHALIPNPHAPTANNPNLSPSLTYPIENGTSRLETVTPDNLDRSLFPLREVPTFNKEGNLVSVRHYTPFKPDDLEKFKHNVPSFEAEPILVIEKLENIFRNFDPSWLDVENLLDTFLTKREKNNVISLTNKKSGRGAHHWPTVDPHWNPNITQDHTKLVLAREALLKAMRDCSDSPDAWEKFEQSRQGINETPYHFMDRLIDIGHTYMDLDLTREKDIKHIRRQFVRNCCLAVKDYFETNCPNWESMDLEELRKVATYAYKNHTKKPETHNTSVADLKKEIEILKEQLKSKGETMAPLQESTDRSLTNPLICLFCGKIGHATMVCRSWLRKNGNNNTFRNNN